MLKGFHAHIYFDPEEVESARIFAARAKASFKCAIGHFHLAPVGPHPRGSCQLSLGVEAFGRFAPWAAEERGALTIFAHGLSGNDWTDHTQHVIWFGPSEPLNVAMFDR